MPEDRRHRTEDRGQRTEDGQACRLPSAVVRPPSPVLRTKGVTLPELVIAVSLMAVVAAVMAPLLHAVQGSWAAKEGGCESLAQGRAFVQHFRQEVSQASRVTGVGDSPATGGYLQFIASDGNEVRYEIGAENNVRFGLPGALSDLAGPAGTLRFTCYDSNDPGTPTTDPNSIDLVKVDVVFLNPASRGRDHALSTSVHIRAYAAEEVYDGEPGVAMKQQIDWTGAAALIDSYRFSLGEYDPANAGSRAVVSVNAIGPNVIALSGGATLCGGAYAGPGGDPATDISVTGGAQITRMKGTLAQAVDIPDLSAPVGPPFDGSPQGDFEYSSGTRVINSNRYFNRMSLTGVAKVIVHGDVTILVEDEFRLENTAQLLLQPRAILRLHVKNDVTLRDSAVLNSSTQNPGGVQLHMIGSGKRLRMEDSARMWAVVQNPNGTIEITGSAQLYGKIKADRLSGGGRIHVDLDSDFD